MNNENNSIQLLNSEEGLRVGEAETGAYIGNTLIAGKEFDWSQLWFNLSYVWTDTTFTNSFFFVVANLNSHNVELQRNGGITIVEAGKIDWYSTGFPNVADIQLFANADYRQRILYYTNWRSTSETINDGQMYNRNYNPGELVYSIGAGKFDQFACITFVFDIPQT